MSISHIVTSDYESALNEQNKLLEERRIKEQLPKLTPIQLSALYYSGLPDNQGKITNIY